MRGTLNTIRQQIVKLLELAVILSVAVLVLDVLWGVVTRELSKYAIIKPSPWTEEVATNLMMWVSLLGAAVAYERNEHLGLDYVVKKFDLALQRVMAILAQCVVVGFAAATLVYGGFALVTKTLASGQVTPALGIKMGYIYLAVPVSGLLIVLFGVHHIAELIEGTRKPFPSSTDLPEETTQAE